MAFPIVLCLLVWSSIVNYRARYEAEQKEARTKEAVPAFVDAARMWAEDRKLDKALKQVDLALLYDPKNSDAHLLKGQVLIAQKKFDDAGVELDKYLALRSDDADARELSQLCRQAKPDDNERMLALYEVLVRQKARGLSDCARPFQREAQMLSPVNRLPVKCDGGPRTEQVGLQKMDKLAQLTGLTCAMLMAWTLANMMRGLLSRNGTGRNWNVAWRKSRPTTSVCAPTTIA